MVSACTLCPAGMYAIPGADSNIRTYPPKNFNNRTDEVPTTFLGMPAFNQNFTLNSTGITYGVGQYSLYSSSVWTINSSPKSNLFLSSGSIARWQANAYERSGNFNTTFVNATYISSDYMGEWLVVQLPYQIRLTGYVFRSIVMAFNHPAEFKMYGSIDGLSFSEIPQASVMNRLTQFSYAGGVIFNKTVTPPSVPLLYLGFTVNKLTATTSAFNRLDLSKFIIYGTEFLDLWTLPDRCASCPTGTYSPVLGANSSIACTNCNAGTFSSVMGAPSVDNCSACVAGTYSLDRASGCQSCSPGTYSTAIGAGNSSTCLACLVGTFSTQQGGVNCSMCPAGFFSGQNATTCEGCPAGSYTTGSGSGVCSLCDAGTYSLGDASYCLGCGTGRYSTAVGGSSNGVCEACTPGKFSNETSASSVSDTRTHTLLFIHRATVWETTVCAFLRPILAHRTR
jgi:hypothetical protein